MGEHMDFSVLWQRKQLNGATRHTSLLTCAGSPCFYLYLVVFVVGG
jgi:hypothetical protein